jgi:hypothetical protein
MTEIGGNGMGKTIRWEALVKILLALAFGLAGIASPRLVGAVYAMQIVTTTVADTVYHADGTAAAGTVIINWPTFTTATGAVIQGGSQSTTLGTGGALSVSLAPNVGATPIGTYYTAVYHLDDGSVQKEYWVIPASSFPVTIARVKNTVLPTSVAMQTVSKSYVDTAIAAAVAGQPLDSSPYVVKTGDTMTGPLVLPGDPVSSTQAADKHYVDTSVAAVAGGSAGKVALFPSGTQIVTQPAGTDLETNRMNGTEYASQYSTIPNVNGIAGATTSADCAGAGAAGLGCTVTVEPTVTGQERYPSKTGWGNQTHVQDQRLGGQHDTYLNPKNPAGGNSESGQGIDVTTTDSTAAVPQATATGMLQSTALDVRHAALAGGSNLYAAELGNVPYFKTTYEGQQVAGVYNTQGQHVLSTLETNCFAIGDCLIGSRFVRSMGGFRDNADEGTHLYDTEIREDPRVFTGQCSTGCTAGSQSLTVGSQTSGGTQGDGRYLIDKNPAGVISAGSLTGSGDTFHSLATFTGTAFPVSTFFLSAALIPSQAHNVAPGTVTVPIATTGVPAGFSTNTGAAPGSSGIACIAGQTTILANWEMVPYTIVDATHLQMALLKPHGSGSTIAIGGLCGYGLEQTVDTINGIRQVFPVIGSYASNGLYYAGSATPVVGRMGQTSAYTNLRFPILSAARGGGVVTLTVPSTSGYDVTGLTMTVAGVTDSSYNGSFAVNSTSATTLTYPEAGPNSTTTGGTISFVTGGYALYPMAEVLSVYNPATKSVDGTFTLAPNTVAWAANDPVEEPHYFQVKVGADTAIVSQFTPRPLIQQNTGYIYQDNVGPTMRGFTIQNLAPASNYFGNGGTHGYPDTAYVSQGIWNRDFDAQAGEQSVFSIHCNSKGCNRWDSAYNLFELDSSASLDTVNYSPQTSVLAMSFRGTSYSFSPLAFTAGTANITTLNVTNLSTGAMSTSSLASSGSLSGASLTTGTITATSETLTGTSTSAAVSTGVVTATTLNGSLDAGNVTSGTLAVARLPAMGASGASHAAGAVPDPGATAGTTRYLREDGTWVSPAGGVTSFNTRTGAVASASGDYSVAQVTGAAPLASPALTGTPTAPTPGNGDNSSKVATTAFVSTALTSVNTYAWNGDCLGYFTFQDTTGPALVDQCNTANVGSLSSTVPPTRTGNGYQFAFGNQADLPASVNNFGTMTMVVELPLYAFGNNPSNQYTPSTILLGTHSSTNNAGFDFLGRSNLVPNVGTYGPSYIAYGSGSGQNSAVPDVFTGTVVLTLVCPTGRGPQIYLGTTLIVNDTTGGANHACGAANPLPNGNYQLGTSSNTVTAALPALALIGKIDLVRFSLTNSMTSAQIAANVALATQIAGQRGIALTGSPYISPGAQYIATGDSITCAYGIVSSPACGYLSTGLDSYAGTTLLTSAMLNQSYGRQIYGAAAAYIQSQIANIPWLYGPQSKSASGSSIASLFEGTNNFSYTAAAPSVWNLAVAWNRIEKSYGARTFYIGMISRASTGTGGVPFDTSKNGLAAAARAGWQVAGYDAFDDLTADPLLGCDGCNTNTTYFQVDHTHPTVVGQTRIAQSVACTINGLDGSSPKLLNPVVNTAASYAATCADGGLQFDTASNSINATMNSALWQTGRLISMCNATTSGSNTLTLTAPSDFPFDNVPGKTSVTVPAGSCVHMTSMFNGNSAAPGDFWSTVR